MNRRDLLAAGAGLTLAEFPFRLASFLQASGERNHESDRGTTRHPVLVRSGFTRKSDDTDEPVTVQTMFSTEHFLFGVNLQPMRVAPQLFRPDLWRL